MGQKEYQIFKELDIGLDNSVYPGHPITVAYLITRCFPNYEAAFQKDGSRWNYASALSSSIIPGAGGNVHAALDFLSYLRNEYLDWDGAIEWADNYWKRCDGQANGGGSWGGNRDGWTPHIDDQPCSPKEYYIDRWKRGQEQADKIKPLLEERDFWWWDLSKEVADVGA